LLLVSYIYGNSSARFSEECFLWVKSQRR
jgi:hypothetical protein